MNSKLLEESLELLNEASRINAKLSENIKSLLKENNTTSMNTNKKVIGLDFGHGLYKRNNVYVYQRDFFDDIVEDEIVMDVGEHLIPKLKEKYDVIISRDIGNYNLGVSGKEKWKECSYEYFKSIGWIPDKFVVHGTNDNNDYQEDINSRPAYFNYYHTKVKPISLVISIHFNAGGGSGCETLYYTGNETTKKIAEILLNCTIAQTGVKKRSVVAVEDKAILKYTKAPTVIWEGAFFDNEVDRTKYLQDADYYIKASSGIMQAIDQSVEENLI